MRGDPEVLRRARLGEGYRTHPGLNVEEWGGVAFHWVTPDNPTGTGTTIWSPFKDDTSHFAPSSSSFMINFRVADLHALLAALRLRDTFCRLGFDEWPFFLQRWRALMRA